MRILFVTNGYPTEKHPEFCVFNQEQIESITATGIQGEVLFINAHEKGVKEYLVGIREIRRRSARFDLIHCFHGLSFLAVKLARVRAPIVVSMLNSVDNEYRELPRPFARLLSQITSRLLNSNRVGKIFKDRVPSNLSTDDLARHIPNGVNMELFSPIDRQRAIESLRLNPRARYLLFVSSKSRQRAQKRYDRFQMVLDRLRNSAEFSDVRELVLERTSREKVPLHFAASELHLLTSDFEGSPNSVKESVACGVPVVAADVGNIRDMLSHIPACAVVAPDDVDAYVAEVRRILASKIDRFEYAELVRDKLRSLGLDQRSTAQRVANLYECVLRANKARTRKLVEERS